MQVWSCGPVISPWAVPSALVGDRSICGNLMVSGQISCGSLSIASTGGISAFGLTAGADGIVSNGPILAKSEVDVLGNLNVSGGSANFSGHVTSTGGFNALGVTVGADGIASDGPILAKAGVDIVGNLNVEGGDTEILGVLNVGGTIGAQYGNFHGGLNVSGLVPGTIYTLGVDGNASITGDADIAGQIKVSGINSIFYQGLVVNAASGQLVALETNGDLEVFGDAFANSWQINSDKRLKTDIKDFKIEKAVHSLGKLRLVSYVIDGQEHHGLIADEVEEVIPQAVNSYEGMKTIDLMVLIDILIAANRELAHRVETLENQRLK